jgi:hypothetical protein
MRSADLELTQTTQPTAIATGGSLTTETTLRGVMDISVTADDPTSGVFQAVLQSNGRTVAKQVLDTNGGKCVPYGEASDGTEIFLYQEPCPLGVSSVDVHFDTASLPDGPQQVSILVTDAAGNAAPILSRAVTVENSGAYLIRQHTEEQERALAALGPCNAQCDEHATLRTGNTALKARKPVKRSFAHSGLVLRGQLLSQSGSAMANATVELSEQPRYEHRPVLLARVTTDADGHWRFRVPQGPSRTLTVGYRARLNDPGYATELSFRELVRAGVVLRAPKHTHPGETVNFRGQLLGGHVPKGGVYVTLKIFFERHWREIKVLKTNQRGEFAYAYEFAPIGTATWRFRARVLSFPGYDFLSAASRPVGIQLLP